MKKVTPYKQFDLHPRKITNVPFSKGPRLRRKPDHLPTTIFHGTCAFSGGGGCIHVKLQDSILNMVVSKNSGTPKSSILIGFSIINHPFWGTPYFWTHPYSVSALVTPLTAFSPVSCQPLRKLLLQISLLTLRLCRHLVPSNTKWHTYRDLQLAFITHQGKWGYKIYKVAIGCLNASYKSNISESWQFFRTWARIPKVIHPFMK